MLRNSDGSTPSTWQTINRTTTQRPRRTSVAASMKPYERRGGAGTMGKSQDNGAQSAGGNGIAKQLYNFISQIARPLQSLFGVSGSPEPEPPAATEEFREDFSTAAANGRQTTAQSSLFHTPASAIRTQPSSMHKRRPTVLKTPLQPANELLVDQREYEDYDRQLDRVPVFQANPERPHSVELQHPLVAGDARMEINAEDGTPPALDTLSRTTQQGWSSAGFTPHPNGGRRLLNVNYNNGTPGGLRPSTLARRPQMGRVNLLSTSTAGSPSIVSTSPFRVSFARPQAGAINRAPSALARSVPQTSGSGRYQRPNILSVPPPPPADGGELIDVQQKQLKKAKQFENFPGVEEAEIAEFVPGYDESLHRSQQQARDLLAGLSASNSHHQSSMRSVVSGLPPILKKRPAPEPAVSAELPDFAGSSGINFKRRVHFDSRRRGLIDEEDNEDGDAFYLAADYSNNININNNNGGMEVQFDSGRTAIVRPIVISRDAQTSPAKPAVIEPSTVGSSVKHSVSTSPIAASTAVASEEHSGSRRSVISPGLIAKRPVDDGSRLDSFSFGDAVAAEKEEFSIKQHKETPTFFAAQASATKVNEPPSSQAAFQFASVSAQQFSTTDSSQGKPQSSGDFVVAEKKPAFSFPAETDSGGKQEPFSFNSEISKTQAKAMVSFGSGTPSEEKPKTADANKKKEEEKEDPTAKGFSFPATSGVAPSFSFGTATLTTTTTTTTTATTAKPPATKIDKPTESLLQTAAKPPTETAVAPAFSAFGTLCAAPSFPATETKPTFTFPTFTGNNNDNNNNNNATADKPATETKPTFTFPASAVNNAISDKPAFSFETPLANQPAAFSFGGSQPEAAPQSAQSKSEEKPAPALSFGSTAPVVSTDSVKPAATGASAFTFGEVKPTFSGFGSTTITSEPAKPAFSGFGSTATLTSSSGNVASEPAKPAFQLTGAGNAVSSPFQFNSASVNSTVNATVNSTVNATATSTTTGGAFHFGQPQQQQQPSSFSFNFTSSSATTNAAGAAPAAPSVFSFGSTAPTNTTTTTPIATVNNNNNNNDVSMDMMAADSQQPSTVPSFGTQPASSFSFGGNASFGGQPQQQMAAAPNMFSFGTAAPPSSFNFNTLSSNAVIPAAGFSFNSAAAATAAQPSALSTGGGVGFSIGAGSSASLTTGGGRTIAQPRSRRKR